jgi:hypothetical protein
MSRRFSPELVGILEGLQEAAGASLPDRTSAIKAARQAPRKESSVDLRSKSVADTPVEEADMFDFSTFVRKLNTLRSGRSMKKHPELKKNLDDYFNNLDDGEKTALVTFLDAIGKIIAADAHPASVPDPSDPPASVKMTRQKAEELVREAIRRHFQRKSAQRLRA